MEFCKRRLKTVQGGKILKPWLGKRFMKSKTIVSNPTNGQARNGRRMLMTYREQGGRQLSLPCPCSCPSQKTLEVFHARNSSVDRNNSRPLFSCICSSITNDCVPVALLHLDCVLPTFWYIAYLWQPKTFGIDRFDLVMTLTKLSMGRSYHSSFLTATKNRANYTKNTLRWTLLCLTVVTQAESIVPHLQSNVECLGHLVNNLFKLRFRF